MPDGMNLYSMGEMHRALRLSALEVTIFGDCKTWHALRIRMLVA